MLRAPLGPDSYMLHGFLEAFMSKQAGELAPRLSVFRSTACQKRRLEPKSITKQGGFEVKNPPNAVIDTIADSVKSSLGSTTYPLVRDLVDDVFTATEEEIEEATKFMMERAKQAWEPI